MAGTHNNLLLPTTHLPLPRAGIWASDALLLLLPLLAMHDQASDQVMLHLTTYYISPGHETLHFLLGHC